MNGPRSFHRPPLRCVTLQNGTEKKTNRGRSERGCLGTTDGLGCTIVGKRGDGVGKGRTLEFFNGNISAGGVARVFASPGN